MNNNYYLAKGINVSTRTIDRSSYIYLEDKKELLQFNEVGSFIWDQIDGVTIISEIIEKCLKEYGGDKEEIISCVLEFIKLLSREKMIEVSSKQFEGVMQSV